MASRVCGGQHREYWTRYPLPLLGIVFIPHLDKAHWLDIKAALAASGDVQSLRFSASEANLISKDSFGATFLPLISGAEPRLPFERAVALARSPKRDEAALGIRVLFHQHPNSQATWDILIDRVLASPIDTVSRRWVHYLAHIPWHGDIAYFGETITDATRAHACASLAALDRQAIVKLLQYIDPETGIARGVIGQSVAAILHSLPGINAQLEEIAFDGSLEMRVREYAALVLAMLTPEGAVEPLEALFAHGSWFATELLRVLREAGHINPY